jgi:hypothetical protein
VLTILGNRFASRIADQGAARDGYQGQQAPWLHEPMLPPNLYSPVPGDRGAHGDFDQHSLSISPQTWAIRHRDLVRTSLLAALVALGGAAFVLKSRPSRVGFRR